MTLQDVVANLPMWVTDTTPISHIFPLTSHALSLALPKLKVSAIVMPTMATYVYVTELGLLLVAYSDSADEDMAVMFYIPFYSIEGNQP